MLTLLQHSLYKVMISSLYNFLCKGFISSTATVILFQKLKNTVILLSILSSIFDFSNCNKCLCLSFNFAFSIMSFNIVVLFCLSNSCSILIVSATCLCTLLNALCKAYGSDCVVNRVFSRFSPINHD